MHTENASVVEEFKNRYGTPKFIIKSPGRVNLIGEHTDYNDGFVLPAAIHKVILMAVAPNNLNKVRAYSVDMGEGDYLSLNSLADEVNLHWMKYVKGIVTELVNHQFNMEGFDLVFGGNIPIGAGMSSSAALEGGLLLGIKRMFDLKLDRVRMAKIGQLTEHKYVGVRCGIMDQFVNLHGRDGKLLKLDCRSLDFEYIPFERRDLKIVLCNSNVSHNLASSEYNVRRAQCEAGINILKQKHPDVNSLRDVTMSMLSEHKSEFDEVVYRRCKYVIEENIRVLEACQDLKRNDFTAFGARMKASHLGLSNDYEVSCKELDVLFDLAKDRPEVLGCRMMGGGFGGCTINLVEEDKVDDFEQYMKTSYREKTGIETEVYITQIHDGVQTLEL